MRGLAIAVAMAVLLGADAAAATSVRTIEGNVQARGPVTLIGAQDLVLTSPGLQLYERPGAGEPVLDSFHLEAKGATVEHYVIERFELEGQPDLLPFRLQGQDEPSHLEDQAAEEATVATFRFTGSPGETTHIRLLARDGPMEVSVAGASRLVAEHQVFLDPFYDADSAFAYRRELGGDPTSFAAEAAVRDFDARALAFSEPFFLLIEGGVAVDDTGRSWSSGVVRNDTRTAVDPVTGTGKVGYDHHILKVSAPSGVLSWPSEPLGWTLAGDQMEGTLDGDIAWTDVQADLHADGEALPVDPKLLHVRGRLAIQATLGESSDWAVEGTVHYLAIDAGPNRVPVAVVGASLLAAALALLAGPGRMLVGFVAGSVGRWTGSDPLRNPGRRRVLSALHEIQPARVRELQEATGLSRGNVEYHLRVLAAYDLVQSRLGTGRRNRTYMLNSMSLLFPVGAVAPPAEGAPADEGPLAGEALAVANSHPLRRRIYEAVRDHGPADFAALREAGGPGLAGLRQSTATHHLQALVRAGALQARRDGKRRLYEAAVHDEEARVQQYRRLLASLHGLEVARRAAAGPAAVPGDAQGRKALLRLRELGLVEWASGRDTYALAGALRAVGGRL